MSPNESVSGMKDGRFDNADDGLPLTDADDGLDPPLEPLALGNDADWGLSLVPDIADAGLLLFRVIDIADAGLLSPPPPPPGLYSTLPTVSDET
jgi:hypothetical protein